MTDYRRLALLVSDTERAQMPPPNFREHRRLGSADDADAVVVLGGDGFMLQTLHRCWTATA